MTEADGWSVGRVGPRWCSFCRGWRDHYTDGHVGRIGENESSLLENIRQTIDKSVHTHTGEWISDTASEYIARDVYNLLSGKGLLPEVAW